MLGHLRRITCSRASLEHRRGQQFEDLIVVNDPVTAERVSTLDDHPLPSLGVMYRGGQRAERVSRRA